MLIVLIVSIIGFLGVPLLILNSSMKFEEKKIDLLLNNPEHSPQKLLAEHHVKVKNPTLPPMPEMLNSVADTSQPRPDSAQPIPLKNRIASLFQKWI
ncbi:hypothetical protein [Kurthia zopfii]|uniref:hypothetical protein n=1 Tax=Kurthia zopfii TaxID=1650 RepID=UPI000F6B66D4|nr:hypothetical protein [Kurthia zopfii]VEI07069.1 Uncharacterised protein [Kurthia zopfii]